jgi:hypothetical protein
MPHFNNDRAIVTPKNPSTLISELGRLRISGRAPAVSGPTSVTLIAAEIVEDLEAAL